MFDSKHVSKRYPKAPQRFSHLSISNSLDNKYLPVISPFTPSTRNARQPQPSILIQDQLEDKIKDGSSTCPIQTEIHSKTVYAEKYKGSIHNQEGTLSNGQNCNEWLQQNYVRIKCNVNKDKHQSTNHYLKLSGNRRKQKMVRFNNDYQNNIEEDKNNFHKITGNEAQANAINQNQQSRQVSITQTSEVESINKSETRYQSLNSNKINFQTGLSYSNNHYGLATPSSKFKPSSNSTDVDAPSTLHYFKKSKQKITYKQQGFNVPLYHISSAFDKNPTQVQSVHKPIQPLPSTVPLEMHPRQSPKDIAFYAQSYKGRRPYNEDRYICQTKGNISLRHKFMNISCKMQHQSNNSTDIVQRNYKQSNELIQSHPHSKYSLFGVFDGHGGSKCSQFIKQNISQILSVNRNLFIKPTQAIKQTFEKLQQKFISLCEKRGHLETSGSCAVVCLVNENKLYVGNIGDSRALLLGPQSVVQITKDHKPDDKQEKARIIRNGGKLYKDGSVLGIDGKQNIKIFNQTRILPGNLNVSRTLGDIQVKLKKFGGLPNTIVPQPDIFTYSLNQDYQYLILATDGLFEGLTNQQIHTIFKTLLINQSLKSQPSNFTAILTKQLIKKASQKSNDNITVICVRLPNQSIQKD